MNQPTTYGGVAPNWSNNIPTNAGITLEVLYPRTLNKILGKSLLNQKYKYGPKYTVAVRTRLKFRL